MDKRSRTCCFSGHRDIPERDVPGVMMRTEYCIRQLIQKGAIYFGVGGAVGYDTLAAELLLKLRDLEFPQIKVILVYPFDGFASRWDDVQRDQYTRMLPRYDKVVCVSQNASKEAYLRRDRHLVDNSAYCICYCTRETGGTAYTVQYAKSKKKIILNVADFDSMLMINDKI